MLTKRSIIGCRLSRRAVVVHASSNTPGGAREPARPVALPSGTLWLLDSMQDQYYNVRGAAFVIPRVEEREIAQESSYAHRAKFSRSKSLPVKQPRPAPCPSTMSLIHQAIAQQPTALTIISDGPLIDVGTEAGEVPVDASTVVDVPSAPKPSAPNTTGIVHVPNNNTDVEADQDDLFQTSSTSPRRTKMLRFTCLANGCRAVNIKPISPESFHRGTVFAQCARCNRWHLIRDHLNLWDQTRRPVYRNGKRVVPPPVLTLEEVPEALRPSPEDLEFFTSGGRVAGWEQEPSN